MWEKTRHTSLDREKFGCVVSTGAKQALFNLMAALIDPGDEVVLLTPYWVSYPEMIRYWGGRAVPVGAATDLASGQDMEAIARVMNDKTKAIILNTPGNPSGVYYGDEWMGEFARLMLKYPKVQIISDEIYSQLFYRGVGPRFPYQLSQELLERTFIIDGISKSRACTGLRIGFVIGRQEVMGAVGKVQGQSTSGANSLVQKALLEYDLLTQIPQYLRPIKEHLLKNSELLQEKLREYGLERLWYPINGAFYFMLSFEGLPILERFKGGE